METILKRLEYNVFKTYRREAKLTSRSNILIGGQPYTSYSAVIDGLDKFIIEHIDSSELPIIITSGEICEILEKFDTFKPITSNDVENYKRFKADIINDFEPNLLIRNGNENIGLVIKTNIRIEPNHIVLTNNSGTSIIIIGISEELLPNIKILNCFKNRLKSWDYLGYQKLGIKETHNNGNVDWNNTLITWFNGITNMVGGHVSVPNKLKPLIESMMLYDDGKLSDKYTIEFTEDNSDIIDVCGTPLKIENYLC